MKYLERCLMETMRIYSPVPIIARRLKEELKIGECNVDMVLKILSWQIMTRGFGSNIRFFLYEIII